MGLKIVTRASVQPVSLEEVKAHLKVDFDDDDDLIESFIEAAVEHAEDFTGRALVEQVWDYFLDEFPSGAIELPKPPLISVDGVFYQASGSEEQFDDASYVVDLAGEPARISLIDGGSWPTVSEQSNAVRVRFTAGYADGDDSPPAVNVSPAIKAAIKLIVGSLYANRETVVVGQTATLIPWSAEQLLRQKRVHKAMA